MIDRWKLTSYCLCAPSTTRGHFEKSSEGVWVLHSDHDAELEQLRGFLDRFQELLALDPENHPGTDLGRLMLEVNSVLHPTGNET